MPLPLWGAVILSRLIVVVAGIASGVAGTRVNGWAQFDPARLSSHLGTVGDALAATAVRWDALHYIGIAQHGYDTSGQTVFFPMYPMLIHLVAWGVGSDAVAGVLVSGLSFAVALVLLHRLTKQELGVEAAGATVLLLVFAPLSFFFTAVYTESLFLALSVAMFYLARRERFMLASVCAAEAALTRVPGILLVAPLAIMYLQAHRLQLTRSVGGLLRGLGVVLLPVLALGGFLIYLHQRGYGWLAPLSNQLAAGHGHSMAGPLVTLWRGTTSGIAGICSLAHGAAPIDPSLDNPFTVGFQNLIYLIVLMICVAALIGAWRSLPRAYSVYAALALVVCLWSPVPILPMVSIDRYALVIFPLWMAAAAKLSARRLLAPVLLLGAVALAFYAYQFADWVFVA